MLTFMSCIVQFMCIDCWSVHISVIHNMSKFTVVCLTFECIPFYSCLCFWVTKSLNLPASQFSLLSICNLFMKLCRTPCILVGLSQISPHHQIPILPKVNPSPGGLLPPAASAAALQCSWGEPAWASGLTVGSGERFCLHGEAALWPKHQLSLPLSELGVGCLSSCRKEVG